jgi:hypothetical protein
MPKETFNKHEGTRPSQSDPGSTTARTIALAVAAMLSAHAANATPDIKPDNESLQVTSSKTLLKPFLEETLAKHRSRNSTDAEHHPTDVARINYARNFYNYGRNFYNYGRNFLNYGRDFENPMINLRSGAHVSRAIERRPALLPNGLSVPESAQILLARLGAGVTS